MSQENVELVRAMNEAFAEGDIEGALAKLHPEVEGTERRVDWTTEGSPEAIAR